MRIASPIQPSFPDRSAQRHMPMDEEQRLGQSRLRSPESAAEQRPGQDQAGGRSAAVLLESLQALKSATPGWPASRYRQTKVGAPMSVAELRSELRRLRQEDAKGAKRIITWLEAQAPDLLEMVNTEAE